MARLADVPRSSPIGGSPRTADVGQHPSLPNNGDERLLRRSLGPTAWAVLADVSMDAQPDGADIQVVTTSARLVAAHLGIAKDTAASALRRLGAAGILRRRPQGTSPAGQFTAGELHLAYSVPRGPCPSSQDTAERARKAMPVAVPAATVTAPTRRRSRATIEGSPAQLSLLDPEPHEIGVGEVGRWP